MHRWTLSCARWCAPRIFVHVLRESRNSFGLSQIIVLIAYTEPKKKWYAITLEFLLFPNFLDLPLPTSNNFTWESTVLQYPNLSSSTSLSQLKPSKLSVKFSRGSRALGANFLANRRQSEEGWPLYKQFWPSIILFKKSSLISSFPNVAGCAPPLDQSTQVMLRFAIARGVSIESMVGK